MKEWLTITEYNLAFWVAGGFALFEFFKNSVTGVEWVFTKFGIETKRMRERRKVRERLEATEAAIKEIKETADKNVKMFTEHENKIVDKFLEIKEVVVEKIDAVDTKIDKQKEEMDKMNEANIKTDRAILRDRIVSGMRYFSQNKDANGNVHISFSDHENMEALFQEYFVKHGNGTIGNMYETEFKHFIIDR